MTGNIINNGTEQFTPIIDKLGNIATEFVPYIIYIAIGILGITITITAVKYIINYLKLQSEDPFNVKRFQKYEGPIYVGIPEERQIMQEANDERDIEKEMYQDYEDYIYKHGKYKDGIFPTQEERVKRIQERKSKHKEYNRF